LTKTDLERIASLEQANKDTDRRIGEFRTEVKENNAEVMRQLTNHIPHQIEAISEKFDTKFDLMNEKIANIKAGSSDMKLVTKVILAGIGIILFAFMDKLVELIF